MGTYKPFIPPTNECIPCPLGTFSSLFGSMTCSGVCDPGYYGTFEGATNVDTCVPCPMGTKMNGIFGSYI
jgi:hypothetical protein